MSKTLPMALMIDNHYHLEDSNRIYARIYPCMVYLFLFHSEDIWIRIFKDSHKEKAPPNKTPALTKSTNMGNWVVGTSNQLFIKGS